MNAVEIEEAISALAEQPFDPTEFPYLFLQAFGNKWCAACKTLRRLMTSQACTARTLVGPFDGAISLRIGVASL
jgi:hypothetical protein